jgi:hypothetical protein
MPEARGQQLIEIVESGTHGVLLTHDREYQKFIKLQAVCGRLLAASCLLFCLANGKKRKANS